MDGHEIPPAVLKLAQTLVANGIALPDPAEGEETREAPLSYRVREIAAELKVAPSTVYRWIEHGALGAMRLGGGGQSIRVPADEFEAFKRRGLMRAVRTSTEVAS